jgi:hypothetical protein
LTTVNANDVEASLAVHYYHTCGSDQRGEARQKRSPATGGKRGPDEKDCARG